MFWLKFAFQSLFQRKKLFFVMLLVIAISMIFLIMVNSATNDIVTFTKEKSYEKYGEHHGVINGLTDKQLNELKNNSSIEKSGSISLAGYTEHVDHSNLGATIGWMDQDALQLGHIGLLKGRMPKDQHEIAIESYLQQAFNEENSLGKTVKLKIGGIEESFKIVGIIENYSANWSAPVDIKNGYNTYPNIFVNRKSVQAKSKIQKSLIFSVKQHKVEEIENDLYENFESHLSNIEQLYANENLFEEGLKKSELIAMFCLLFSIVLILGSMLCCYQLFEVFYRDYRKKMAILRAYGAKKYHSFLLIFYQSLILILISFLVAFPIGILFKGQLHPQRLTDMNVFSSMVEAVPIVIIWTGLLFCSLCFTGWMIMGKMNKHSIAHHLKGNQLTPKGSRLYQKIANLPFKLKSLLIQLLFHWKSTVLLTAVLACSILMFFFTQLIADETLGHDDQKTLNYTLASKQMIIQEQVNGFMIETNQSVSFRYQTADELLHFPGVLYVDKYPNTLETTLLLTKQQLSPYFVSWINDNKQENTDGEISESMVDHLNIPKNLTPIPNVKFVLVNDQELNYLKKNYHIEKSAVEKFEKSKTAFLFLPKAALKNRINSQDHVKIGRVEQTKKNEELTFKHWDFKVGKVISAPFQIKMNQVPIERDGITVAISEKVAHTHHVFSGYKQFVIFADLHISKENKKALTKKAKQIVASIPGSMYDSDEEHNEKYEVISNYLSILGMILFLTTTFYSALSLAAVMYSKAIQRQTEHAIYRAVGKSVKAILKDLLIELIVYLMIAFLVSGLIIWMMMLTSPPASGVFHYLRYYWYAVLSIASFAMLSLLVPYYKIKSMSISNSLKIDE
ncbi:ABC transporter permease [Bacillus changyiensis]|uniref:ABC transporter permease n=1 Tax=Bacillus changyiensis TaxID=3004103 RepID=UPI0022E8682B|nr:ABC transporter permease [Bacillus changyiensis]MDA1477176.1 ABC transporter permease [Bacillus changyiensis]